MIASGRRDHAIAPVFSDDCHPGAGQIHGRRILRGSSRRAALTALPALCRERRREDENDQHKLDNATAALKGPPSECL